jgi:hypothetical protein
LKTWFSIEKLALIARGLRETPRLVGARARFAHLMVFLPWQSYGKTNNSMHTLAE